jgi:flavin reductase (DIM6/NTAB) family NADH-FMN oxidoreductase RutF
VVGSATTATGASNFFSRTSDLVKKDAEATLPQDGYTPSALDQKEFRGVLSQFGSGVAVITTQDETGEQAGMTVSSFTSLSLDPPLVLFCAKEGSKTMAEVQENGHFAVSILREDQKELCYQFAGKSDTDKFKNVNFHPGKAHGDPLLDGAIATLECKLSTRHPGGDHSIVIGEVIGISRTSEADQPLLFWDGKVLPPRS